MSEKPFDHYLLCWWARVAAVLLLGLLGWQTYQYGWAPSRYQTAFGQQQRWTPTNPRNLAHQRIVFISIVTNRLLS